MTRRRIILAAVALLLAAFVMAVQRDTFVRRWCLPTPPPATRPAGPLDQVIEEFEVDDARRSEKLRELERRSGVRIRPNKFRSPGDSFPNEPFAIRRATVEQLLRRVLYADLWFDDPFTMDADGFVTFGDEASNRRSSPTMARVHARDRDLLEAKVPAMRRLVSSTRRLIHELGVCTLHRDANGSFAIDSVLRFGDKLIVVTTPRNHWLIDQVLREEADALQAKLAQPAATLPAR